MQRLNNIFKDTMIITRSPVVALEIKADSSISDILSRLSSVIDVNSGDTLKIIRLDGYVEIIIDEDKLSDVMKLIPRGNLQALRPGLCEITFILNNENNKTINSKEIFKAIYSELVGNNIDVVQTISYSKGYTFLVDKKA